MRKILLLALLLSLAVYALTQDTLAISYQGLVYQIPVLYPALALTWLFCGGIALGLQWNIWEKYRMRSQIRYYQSCANEAEKRLDEARWLVCESVQGRPLLRLSEISEDYEAMMSIQGELLDQIRYHNHDIVYESNRVIEQALKEERKIHLALQSTDPIEALHNLQSLPWDSWIHIDTVDYLFKQWDLWSDPVRVFLITKIAPTYWRAQHQEALWKTIEADAKPEKWIELLRKYKWNDQANVDPKILEELKLLA